MKFSDNNRYEEYRKAHGPATDINDPLESALPWPKEAPVSSSSPELFPDDSDPIAKVQAIEQLLAKQRHEVDQTIVTLFNHYKAYSETMVQLINSINHKNLVK